MNDEPTSVTEADLHAFVDGFLDDERRDEVERWLRDHPDEAAEVARWQAQNSGLKAAFSPYARTGANDHTLVNSTAHRASAAHHATAAPWRRRAGLVAASLALFLSGATAGVYGNRLLDRPAAVKDAAALENLPSQSKTAFLVYTSEKRHPVEVGADEEAHLVSWLGKRLDYKLVAPDLRPQGFALVGGRLLPVNGKAGAMLMYQDTVGKRLTVLLGRNPQSGETSFRFQSEGPVETFYWIDGDIGYAVSGELPRATLQRVAEECYRQFGN